MQARLASAVLSGVHGASARRHTCFARASDVLVEPGSLRQGNAHRVIRMQPGSGTTGLAAHERAKPPKHEITEDVDRTVARDVLGAAGAGAPCAEHFEQIEDVDRTVTREVLGARRPLAFVSRLRIVQPHSVDRGLDDRWQVLIGGGKSNSELIRHGNIIGDAERHVIPPAADFGSVRPDDLELDPVRAAIIGDLHDEDVLLGCAAGVVGVPAVIRNVRIALRGVDDRRRQARPEPSASEGGSPRSPFAGTPRSHSPPLSPPPLSTVQPRSCSKSSSQE
jgi:hypothetical protein